MSLRLSNHSAGMLRKTQMKILSDIAGAMAFLHSQNIVLRDLKTENCGFDSSGSIKLFDFGLAARLPAACRDDGISNSDTSNSNHRHHTNIMKEQGTSDQYKFSIEGGTLRYMSPEAVLGKPYGLTLVHCDLRARASFPGRVFIFALNLFLSVRR